MKTKSRLITASYPVSNPERAAGFYGALLGTDLARSLTDQMVSFHTRISAGVELTLNPPQGGQKNAVLHFAVDDLDSAVRELEQHGGKRVAGPFDLPLARETMERFEAAYRKAGGRDKVGNSLGKGIIVQDPDGNAVGLIQLEPFANAAFRRGELSEEDVEERRESVETGKHVQGGRR